MKNLKSYLSLFSMLIFFLISFSTPKAQKLTSDLVITGVHLEKNNPDNNWIVVYNQTNKVQTLGKLFISNIRTISVLPPKVRKAGGVKLNPEQSIILCANKKAYTSKWDKKNDLILEVKALGMIAEGGYISVSINEGEIYNIDLFRYGNASLSSNHKDLVKYQVVPFAEGNKVYKRETEKGSFKKYGNWF